jgi:predicted HicB family RNase H-like nuclease
VFFEQKLTIFAVMLYSKVQVTFRCNEEFYEVLKKNADRQGLTVAAWVRKYLIKNLSNGTKKTTTPG